MLINKVDDYVVLEADSESDGLEWRLHFDMDPWETMGLAASWTRIHLSSREPTMSPSRLHTHAIFDPCRSLAGVRMARTVTGGGKKRRLRAG